MSFRYTSRRIMSDIDCSENKDLCRMILKHDPKMISQMYNIDFELVKPIIDKSITLLERANLRLVTNDDELSEIMLYAYKKSSTFRKQAMEAFFSLLTDEKSSFNYYIQDLDREGVKLDSFNKVATLILTENPIYLLVIKDKILKKAFKHLKLNYQKTVKGFNFKKIYKTVEKRLDKPDGRNFSPSSDKTEEILHKISKNDLTNPYWQHSEFMVDSDSIEDKINAMLKDFPDIPEISAIYLLIKMK